jgi:hypothetical protein
MLWLALTPERLTNSQPPPSQHQRQRQGQRAVQGHFQGLVAARQAAVEQQRQAHGPDEGRGGKLRRQEGREPQGTGAHHHHFHARVQADDEGGQQGEGGGDADGALGSGTAAPQQAVTEQAVLPCPAWRSPRAAPATRTPSDSPGTGMKKEPHDIHDCGWK